MREALIVFLTPLGDGHQKHLSRDQPFQSGENLALKNEAGKFLADSKTHSSSLAFTQHLYKQNASAEHGNLYVDFRIKLSRYLNQLLDIF